VVIIIIIITIIIITVIIIIIIVIMIIIIIIIIIIGSLPSFLVEDVGKEIFKQVGDDDGYLDLAHFKQLISFVDVDTNMTVMF
jgi:hypothetical protein